LFHLLVSFPSISTLPAEMCEPPDVFLLFNRSGYALMERPEGTLSWNSNRPMVFKDCSVFFFLPFAPLLTPIRTLCHPPSVLPELYFHIPPPKICYVFFFFFTPPPLCLFTVRVHTMFPVLRVFCLFFFFSTRHGCLSLLQVFASPPCSPQYRLQSLFFFHSC